MWIASSGAQKTLLEEEFPNLHFVELPGYKIKYGRNRLLTLVKIILSIPKILIRIKREKDWMRQFFILEKPDAVISDNRYGLYTPGLYSIFITHQLRILTPFGKFADDLLQRINYRFINRFSLCWIPDRPAGGSLAGELSHPDRMPTIPSRYIGLLSRMEKPAGSLPEHPSPLRFPPAPVCDVLILLSGPEPQRTILELEIRRQLPSFPGRAILIRGLPQTRVKGLQKENSLENDPAEKDMDEYKSKDEGSSGLKIYDHLPAGALNAVMLDAKLVIARAGYSTIMDLIALGKKSVLIPTPGQTEQEYLGDHLSGRRIALCIPQAEFSLSRALEAAGNFPFTEAANPDEQKLLEKEIRAVCLELIKKSQSASPK